MKPGRSVNSTPPTIRVQGVTDKVPDGLIGDTPNVVPNRRFIYADTSDVAMNRHDYMVQLIHPRGARGNLLTRTQILARKRAIRDLLRQFELELQPLRRKDPHLRVQKRADALIPLIVVNTLPKYRGLIGELKSVRSIDEVPQFGLIR
jgi:hypothetical protein